MLLRKQVWCAAGYLDGVRANLVAVVGGEHLGHGRKHGVAAALVDLVRATHRHTNITSISRTHSHRQRCGAVRAPGIPYLFIVRRRPASMPAAISASMKAMLWCCRIGTPMVLRSRA
jgi:hypothetical protein